jgi:general stress protein 26
MATHALTRELPEMLVSNRVGTRCILCVKMKMVKDQRVTFELVLSHLRKRDFAVLSTVSGESRPHSVGVNYGVSRSGRDLVIYVMTRKHLQKARNIAQNPSVSLVVPLTSRLLWFLPPPTIQLQGRAEIVDWTDEAGTEVFRRFWMGRRILEAYQESHRRGETRICFLKITPDPVVSTYMVGYGVWELRKRMESGATKVVIPPEYRSSAPPSRSAG